MPFQDFSGNPANEQWARSLLVPGEELVAIVAADRRTISITDRRIILNEGGGQFSAIRNDQIAAIEVSDGRDQKFLKLHFGGGLSRTISAPDASQAAVILGAIARG